MLRKPWFVPVFILLISLSGNARIEADDWGTGTGPTGAQPDGSTHNWCWGIGFDSDLQDNVNSSFYDALDAPTDAQVEFKSTCKLTGDGETDTVWFDADLPGGQRGQVFCEDFDNNLCDQFYVTLDPTELNIGSNDEADTTKTSCHELGHSVGLSHGAGGGNGGADDCMMSGEWPNLNSQYERYSLHHKEHINDWF